MRIEVPVLRNAVVRLEPLRADHAEGLALAASGPRDSYGWTAVPTPETVAATIAAELARPAFRPFVQVDAAGDRIVGHTAYLTPRHWPDGRLLAIEIGSTWLHPDAQGTAINPAAKLLLLDHAFGVLGVSRVDIKTDARNARARAAILAIGAGFEGVLRSWQPSGAPGEEGLPRDTAMFSITAGEWPRVRERLEARIARRSAP
ncbi:MAG: GNAT family N-acetyltransferase [Micrococcales bacterium 73-13]|nr:MAG: GNAT family N-acetyltransferase [Micrococcales bacterium 73-13]